MAKTKTCSVCLKEFPSLWKAKTKTHGAMCQNCWGGYSKVTKGFPDGLELGNVKMFSKDAYKKRISPISEKKAKELVLYRKVRDEYFRDHPTCEYPRCTSRDITLHHGAGRLGSLLTDKRYFKSLCIPHHDWAEMNPDEAKRLGLSFTRTDK